MNIVIERWHEKLGGSRYASFSAETNSLVPASIHSEVQGWYAQYKEGVFAYWLQSGKHFVHWRGVTKELAPGSTIGWASEMLWRKFEVRSGSKTLISVRYHTLARAPWRLITDLVAPDDDWGLFFDLPSFIHSHYSSGKLPELLQEWNRRGGS
jgi:hypothetical protein